MEVDGSRKLWREHVKIMLEHVGTVCEQWPIYQNIREDVVEQLRKGGDPNIPLEDKVARLTDCEVAVSIAAYYLGMQEGYRQAKMLDDGTFLQYILDTFSEMDS